MIRRATDSDYPAFVRLFAQLQTGDNMPALRVWSEEIAPQSLVAQADGQVVGYIHFQVLRRLGLVRHLAVDPSHRRRGLAQALMHAAADAMRQAGVADWCLNVKPDNAPALALYEGMGMVRQFASIVMRMAWDIIDRLPPVPASVHTAALLATDDAAAEATLAVPAGLLSQQRARTGAHLLLARDTETIANPIANPIVGIAAFRPEFPGAFPFRATSPGVARALLEAMRPHADPNRAYVQLVFEGAPALAHAFGQAGAAQRLEIIQLQGPLPASSPGRS